MLRLEHGRVRVCVGGYVGDQGRLCGEPAEEQDRWTEAALAALRGNADTVALLPMDDLPAKRDYLNGLAAARCVITPPRQLDRHPVLAGDGHGEPAAH